jgi:hypothetical protein
MISKHRIMGAALIAVVSFAFLALAAPAAHAQCCPDGAQVIKCTSIEECKAKCGDDCQIITDPSCCPGGSGARSIKANVQPLRFKVRPATAKSEASEEAVLRALLAKAMAGKAVRVSASGGSCGAASSASCCPTSGMTQTTAVQTVQSTSNSACCDINAPNCCASGSGASIKASDTEKTKKTHGPI